MHDSIFLSLKSEVTIEEDLQVADELIDTLIAHKEGCVGRSANIIGVRKRIIVFDNEGIYMAMFNPEIIKKSIPTLFLNGK
jgi:peptide deformylase